MAIGSSSFHALIDSTAEAARPKRDQNGTHGSNVCAKRNHPSHIITLINCRYARRFCGGADVVCCLSREVSNKMRTEEGGGSDVDWCLAALIDHHLTCGRGGARAQRSRQHARHCRTRYAELCAQAAPNTEPSAVRSPNRPSLNVTLFIIRRSTWPAGLMPSRLAQSVDRSNIMR